ncbi:agamous-like MADS-box protein AGL97 [Raphanus sativus]|uniref:Agamous-like MADS-box protein AGL97 n=1 Tax=Raphanus sativus TaxID=3726 RepID=A0A6J0N0W6_RAPSA|nr:agamous-like MADS-box protein AGL97 [Raphanus sativus]KAJ4917590.1 agamous-like MADS-box protein AGL97 [Raphanus sativus]
MVKKGGTKRKPVMTKITDKASRATTFTKRRDGLYSKAAQLCVITDAQIAILATPSSSNSNVPFFSFGHSSVESMVSSGQRLAPVSTCDNTKATREDLGICMARKDLGLGFWWDDDKLVKSNDPEELMEAMESMKVLYNRLKELEDQTLTTTTRIDDEDMVEISPESDEWSEMDLHKLLQDCDCDCDDVPPLHDVVSNTEEDHNVSEQTCNNNNNFVSLPELDEWSEMVLNQLLEDCDHVPEHHNVSEETCNNNNNFVSLPVAGILEEEAMNIDWDTIFASDEELLSDEYKMYV